MSTTENMYIWIFFMGDFDLVIYDKLRSWKEILSMLLRQLQTILSPVKEYTWILKGLSSSTNLN